MAQEMWTITVERHDGLTARLQIDPVLMDLHKTGSYAGHMVDKIVKEMTDVPTRTRR
jgi:hypothetical protein